jgi:hypothetical protein
MALDEVVGVNREFFETASKRIGQLSRSLSTAFSIILFIRR